MRFMYGARSTTRLHNLAHNFASPATATLHNLAQPHHHLRYSKRSPNTPLQPPHPTCIPPKPKLHAAHPSCSGACLPQAMHPCTAPPSSTRPSLLSNRLGRPGHPSFPHLPPQAYERGPGSSGWSQVSAWETDVAVTQLAWAHPEYGRVLAGGTSSGSVLVWGQLPELQVQVSLGLGPGAGAGGGGEAAGGFQPLAELPCGTAPCRWVYSSAGSEGGVQ